MLKEDRLEGDKFEKGRAKGDTGKAMHQGAALGLNPVGRTDREASQKREEYLLVFY